MATNSVLEPEKPNMHTHEMRRHANLESLYFYTDWATHFIHISKQPEHNVLFKNIQRYVSIEI